MQVQGTVDSIVWQRGQRYPEREKDDVWVLGSATSVGTSLLNNMGKPYSTSVAVFRFDIVGGGCVKEDSMDCKWRRDRGTEKEP